MPENEFMQNYIKIMICNASVWRVGVKVCMNDRQMCPYLGI